MITGKGLPRRLRKKIKFITENGIILDRTENTTEESRQRAGIKLFYGKGAGLTSIHASCLVHAYNSNDLFEKCLDFVINEIKFNR